MSTLKADTIQSTGGGAATLTKQAAFKAFFSYEMDSPSSIKDSLNASSITDNGAGDATLTVSSAFANTNYGSATECGDQGTGDSTGSQISGCDATTARTTTVYRAGTFYWNSTTNRTLYDSTYQTVSHMGDLA